MIIISQTMNFIYLPYDNVTVQGVKKVSFTACHSGKLLLVSTNPRVFLISSPQKILTSSIDYISSVILISPKTSLAPRAS